MRAQGNAVDVFEDAFAPGQRVAMALPGGEALPDGEAWPQIVAVGAANEQAVAEILDGMQGDPSVRDCYVAPPRSVLTRTSGASARRTASARPAAHWGVDMVKAGIGAHAEEVIVGVVDSGVDRTHPDLKDAVIGYENFTGETDKDINGHGRMCAGSSLDRGTGPPA